MIRFLPLFALAACARDFTLPPPTAAGLRGRVTKDGTGVGGAEVRLDRRSSAALTRADGAFSFKPVAPGTHALLAAFDSDSDGLAELTAASAFSLAGGDDLDLGAIELRPTGAVSGTVHARGAVLPDALVFVPGTSRVTFSDSNGTYALVGLPAGPLAVAASGTLLVPQRRDVEVPSGDALTGIDFDLADATGLPPAGAFTGTVRFTEAPNEPPAATALAYSGATLAAASDTQAGAFRLGPLAPGVFNVRVDAPNHRTHVLPLEPLGEGDFDLGEVWLEPGTPSAPGPDVALPDAGTGAPPTAVQALQAAGGDGRITLSWKAPAAGAQGYRVYRGTNPVTLPPALDGGLTADLFFVDSAVTNYVRYVYRVTAFQFGLESPLVEAPQVQAFAGAGTILTGGSGTRTLTPAGNPHVVSGGDLIVLQGETLTLAPGTVMQFDPQMHLVVDGTLVARGTALQPIQFGARTSQPWGGIVFESTATDAVVDPDGTWRSGSVLEHCVVEQSNDTGVTIVGSSPAVLDSDVRNNSVYPDAGVTAAGGGLWIGPGSAPLIKGCTIHHNHSGILENNTTSTQLGAGLYSEGDPVLVDNDISFNVLEGTSMGNSTSWGAAVFLRRGQATLCGNRFSGNSVTGGGQANASQTIRLRGLVIAIDDGSHLLLGNTLEANGATRVDWVDFQGTVWMNSGNHVLAHNRIAGNTLGNTNTFAFTRVGGALSIETANVRAHLNQLVNNSLSGPGTVNGSAVYSEATSSDLRFNDFSGNTPLGFEVHNTGVVPLNLSGSWFEDALLADGGVMPVSDRVFRPTFADLSGLATAPVPDTGPKRCANDAACAPLGGAQKCHWGQCVAHCLVLGCPAVQSCHPLTGACQ